MQTTHRAYLNSAEASCKLRNHNDDDGMNHNEHDNYTYALRMYLVFSSFQTLLCLLIVDACSCQHTFKRVTNA